MLLILILEALLIHTVSEWDIIVLYAEAQLNVSGDKMKCRTVMWASALSGHLKVYKIMANDQAEVRSTDVTVGILWFQHLCANQNYIDLADSTLPEANRIR
jgi:hypothetical protein